ncbi:PiggyBac transposable element-derived protein like [Argiope bruennichi]|uniref:PiggyBac transposable element-derived protein like n=1 Tax=Argiope bruennichi TaxID=94029 RepID=A0A8T0F6J2_ARGBR|nr:PiggyBac transposable element-derived protein like [Argiope bruennichi]
MDSEEYSDSDSSYSDFSSESDEDASLDDARDWCRLDEDNLGPSPPRFPFTANPGVKVEIHSSSPLEFFGIFFDDDIVSFIASETNRFAEDFIENNELTPSSRSHNWKDMDSSEIRVFLALLILQGILQKPIQKLYWSQIPYFYTPFFGQIMSERRFALLMKFLHFTNNATIDTSNHPQPGLRKIYEVYEALNRKFKSSYIPECEVTVDESLLLYKGRLVFKQYLPKKKSKFGVKFYQLCESSTGYIWNSLVYTGRDMPLWQNANNYSSTTNIVMTLMENLLGKGYCVTLDNFYTSPELAEILITNKTDVYGTLRSYRRGIPQEIKDRNIKKGEIIGFQKGKMCILKYMDKKPIHMLSTIHTIDFVEKCKRKKKSNGDIEEIKTKKPKAVLDYNRTMGGVDMADQCLSYYPTVRNQQKKVLQEDFQAIIEPERVECICTL